MRIVHEIDISVTDFENSIFQELVCEQEAVQVLSAIAITYPEGFIEEAVALLKLVGELDLKYKQLVMKTIDEGLFE